ncbi:MAG: hypothetical protein D6807_01440 [Alphaproteobacteria bacterium]|nr:MAG: hypothetical protein D6807_01440 [Alphaproteobacteria bacterium]
MTESDDLRELTERYPALSDLRRFSRLLARITWFRDIGDPLDEALTALAEDYAAGLGFPDAAPAVVLCWEDARSALETRDYNSPAWEAEEQLRMGLLQRAREAIPDPVLAAALGHIGEVAAGAAEAGAHDIARFLQIADPDFPRLATGSAVQAAHQAGLLLAAADSDAAQADHPFALKLRIFERGRWPLGIAGLSLNIF